MSVEKIRWKIFLPSGLVLASLTVICSVLVHEMQDRHAEHEAESLVQQARNSLQVAIDTDSELISSLADQVKQNEDLRTAWRTGARDGLMELARPIFEDHLARYHITHFYFHGLDRVCFLRVHNPSRHGDVINRATIQTAEITGKPFHGIELGPFGTFTLRVVHPWRIDGQLVGYIELGEEIEHIAPQIRQRHGVEIAMTIDKSLVQRSKWEEGQRMIGRSGRWEQLTDSVLIDYSSETALSLFDRHFDGVKDGSSVNLDEREYRKWSFPLLDASEQQVGSSHILVDTTSESVMSNRMIGAVLAFGICSSLLLGSGFWIYLGRIETRLTTVRAEMDSALSQRRERQAALESNQAALKEAIGQREQAEAALQRRVNELLETRTSLLDVASNLEKENAERKRSEEKLIRSETKFRTLYDSTSDAVMLLDENGFFDCNNATLRIFGCKDRTEFCGRHPSELSPAKQPCGTDSATLANQQIAAAMKGGCNRFEWVHRRFDTGEEFPAEVLLNAMELDGRPVFQAVVRDISERKRAETLLQESRDRFEQAATTVSDLIYEWDVVTDRLDWMGDVDAALGYPQGTIPSTIEGFLALIHPEDKQEIADAVEFHRKSSTPLNLVYRIRHKDGEWRCWEERGSAVLDDSGRPIKVIGACSDITKRKQVEEKLKRSQATFQTILESMPVGVVIVGRDKIVRHANSAALAMMECDSKQQVVGRVCHNTLCPAQEGKCPVLDLGREVDNAERVLVTKNKKKVPILKTVIPIILDDEEVLLETFVDITERKQTEQALKDYSAALESAYETLEQYGETAEAANQAKSEFLANMSHEIRTPMTAIIGFADVLLGEDGIENAPPERLNALETIKRNGLYLLELINDILDLSKIEAGKLDVERIACSPSRVVADVASLMRVRAEAKDIPLNIEYAGGIPETIQCDSTRLRQILINLLGNAIKFTETGSVRLVTRLVQDTAKPPRLQFDVIDTGIGLAPDQVVKLFQPFAQGDASTTRKFGGTGLGLTISKRLAELLGGDITIDSNPGKGSVFSVTVETGPLDNVPILENVTEASSEKEQKTKAVAAISAAKLDCRILLAEDGPDNQRLISFVLKKAGAEVTLAENGLIAHDKALAARDAGEPFDIILMDMQMPIMDGYTATRKLRDADYTNPIIALTANAMAGDDEKCRRAGCDGYATKPIDRAKLFATIAQFLDQGVM